MPFYYVNFELAIQSYPLKHGIYKHRKGPPLCTKVVARSNVCSSSSYGSEVNLPELTSQVYDVT